MRSSPCLLVVALLAACSKPVPTAPVQAVTVAAPAPVTEAAKPTPQQTVDDKVEGILMKAVYGGAYRDATHDALVELPDPDNREQTGMFVVSAVAHTVLPGGETVLVANAESASDDGTALSSHASGGLLNVYLMRQVEGKWEILKRHENVAALGSHGNLGSVEWVALTKGKPGLAILSGGTWQGYTVEGLSLFDLGADSLRDLADGIQIHSDSEGGCDSDGEGECWSVTGKWRVEPARAAAEYDDIVIDFLGQTSTRMKAAKGQGKPSRVAKKVGGTARYAFDGKIYRLVEGVNPVPGV